MPIITQHARQYIRHVPLLRGLCFAVMLVGLASLLRTAAGDDASPRLYELDPYDQITVDETNGGGTYKVLPLDFPNRRVPAKPDPSAMLRVRMLADPDTPAEIAWRSIAKVELFEQLVLAEAEALVAKTQFEEAFDYYAFLHKKYPDLPELPASTENFVYRNAGWLFQQGKYTEALALLEEVFDRDPKRNGLSPAITAVTEKLLRANAETGNYLGIRLLLERTEKRGGSDTLVAQWRTKLTGEAAEYEKSAREQLGAKRFREAHAAARKMLEIDPEFAGGRELASEIAEQYPMVRIATGPALPPGWPLAAWHPDTLRRNRLLTTPFMLPHCEPGAGVKYESPWGRFTTSADRKALTISPRTNGAESQPVAYPLSASLLSLLRGENDAAAANLSERIDSLEVNDEEQLVINFDQPHPRPEALLTVPAMVDEQGGQASAVPYRALPGQADAQSFVANARIPTQQPQEIVELTFSSGAQAIQDLKLGRIDGVERVEPQDVPRLTGSDGTKVYRYRLPTLHVLVPNQRNARLRSTMYRRALCYGLNRRSILEKELLGGQDLAGCRLISAPLMAAQRADDAVAYGYDDSVEPLPYEPRLALTLLQVAENELASAAKKSGEKLPEARPLVVGFDGSPLARRACAALVANWRQLGIAAEAKDMSSASPAEIADCDLWYTQFVITEPLVDVPRMFRSGAFGQPSAPMRLALRRLESATNLPQVRQRLREIHALLHYEQTVIPLWQIAEHFAVRDDLAGISDEPHSLYQDIRNWRFTSPAGK